MFEATRWSLILAVGQSDTVQAAAAREEICRTYWHAIYSVIRARGRSLEDAQDLTQDFFCVHLLEKNAFQGLDPGRGRFRHFLLATLRNYLNNQYDHDIAQKRRPEKPLVSLDDAESRYQAVASANQTEGMVFDRQWALAIVDRAMTRLRDQWIAKGKVELFEALKEFLTRDPSDGEYDALGAKFQMQNKALAMTVSRLRRTYGELVRDEMRQTVEDERDMAEEMNYLVEVLSR